MNEQFFCVDGSDSGKRIDKWLAEQVQDLNRSSIQKLCQNGGVLCGQKQVAKNYKLQGNETIRLLLPKNKSLEILPQNIALDIVYEDEDLLIVNKQKGMVVHPAPGNDDGTLVNALLYHCGEHLSDVNGNIRPGILHRIDKDTSGLLIVAKNNFAHAILAEQIKAHSFTRIYNAVVYGGFPEEKGTIDLPIGRCSTDRKKMCVTNKNSKNAITHYRILQRFGTFTHMELQLETGRTHQIRVHMAYKGHPVAGDPVYGPKKGRINKLNGQCLHAKTIGFIHPRTSQYIEFTSELPNYYQQFLKSLYANQHK